MDQDATTSKEYRAGYDAGWAAGYSAGLDDAAELIPKPERPATDEPNRIARCREAGVKPWGEL